jgi:chromosome segregation ATPase
LKNQELKELNDTFNTEMSRMNDIISAKEKSIDTLNASLNHEKEKILEMTRSYTTEITNLVHDKNRLKEEVDDLHAELTATKEERRHFEAASDKALASLEGMIVDLKEELDHSHADYIREKDKHALVEDDLHREIVAVRAENERAGVVSAENGMLCREIRNLKDLLLESSLEMERCKDEFLRIGREKDNLAVKVRELGFENETLYRMKFEKEEEARGWRESYYMSRRV